MKVWRVEVERRWVCYVVAENGLEAANIAERDVVHELDPDDTLTYEEEVTSPAGIPENELVEIPWGDPDVVQDRSLDDILWAIEDERPPERCPHTRELPL